MNKEKINRILLSRTDRMGDVLLTTPAIQAVRDEFPNAYIAMLIRPYTESIVRNNPFLDEVIVYDKYGKHNSILSTFLFSMNLRSKKFDIGIAFHPTNRVHTIFYLSRIPVRIGYDRKLEFLLTHPIRHTKQYGVKHESEYTMDMLELLGICQKKFPLTLKISHSTENKIRTLLRKKGYVNKNIVAIQPGSSCPSKIWPSDKYVRLVREINKKFSVKFLIIGDNRSKDISEYIEKKLDFNIWNTTSEFPILEVAGLLKYCSLLISNDSAPVHIATAVKTPVITMFGRNQPGLSPTRWGPLGEEDTYIHKDIGCQNCLAHNCNKDFKCISSIKVEEVLDVLEEKNIL